MSDKKISVIVKRSGGNPYKTNISPSGQNLRTYLGGTPKMSRIFLDCVILSADDNMKGLNCTVCGKDYYGDIIFAGYNDGELSDIPIDFPTFKKVLGSLFDRETEWR